MHQTVLKQLAVDYLQPRPAPAWYIDATFGAGGHTETLLSQGARVIAFDFDEVAIQAGQTKFAAPIAAHQLILIRENFAKLSQVISQLRQSGTILSAQDEPILGVLFDFGTSTDQLMSADRGFSFHGEGALDMRLDTRLGVTARDLLLALPESALSQLFQEFGGESFARPIARKIIQYRTQTPLDQAFRSNQDLVNLVLSVKRQKPTGHHGHSGHPSIHPATKVFQALRIAVNNEIENIELALSQAFAELAPQGRLVTIAFHEGEDRPVKQYFRSLTEAGLAQALTKKPLVPSPEELALNPRARSAKLRAVQKI